MAKSKNPSILLLSPEVRLSFPKLWVPEPYVDPETQQPKGDPVFSTEMICSEENLSKFRTWDDDNEQWVYDNLNTFAARLAKQKNGADFDVNGAIQHGGISWPVTNGNKRIAAMVAKGKKAENYEHYADSFIVRGKALTKINERANAPALYYFEDGVRKALARGTDQGEQLAQSLFYGGAWVVAELSAVAGSAGDNKYVTLYINSVCFIRHDTKFGGGNRLMDRFEGVSGGASDYDPTSGMDEEIAI